MDLDSNLVTIVRLIEKNGDMSINPFFSDSFSIHRSDAVMESGFWPNWIKVEYMQHKIFKFREKSNGNSLSIVYYKGNAATSDTSHSLPNRPAQAVHWGRGDEF